MNTNLILMNIETDRIFWLFLIDKTITIMNSSQQMKPGQEGIRPPRSAPIRIPPQDLVFRPPTIDFTADDRKRISLNKTSEK